MKDYCLIFRQQFLNFQMRLVRINNSQSYFVESVNFFPTSTLKHNKICDVLKTLITNLRFVSKTFRQSTQFLDGLFTNLTGVMIQVQSAIGICYQHFILLLISTIEFETENQFLELEFIIRQHLSTFTLKTFRKAFETGKYRVQFC